MYIFYYSRFLSNLRLPWKTDVPWNFSLYWNIFYYSGFLRNLWLPWKQSLPWNFSSPGGRPPPRLVRLCLQVLPFVHNVGCGLRHALKLSWLTLVTASRLVLLPARAIVGHKISQVAEVDDFFEPSSVHEDTCLRCIGVRLLVHHNVFFRYCWRVIYSRSAPPYLCFFSHRAWRDFHKNFCCVGIVTTASMQLKNFFFCGPWFIHKIFNDVS